MMKLYNFLNTNVSYSPEKKRRINLYYMQRILVMSTVSSVMQVYNQINKISINPSGDFINAINFRNYFSQVKTDGALQLACNVATKVNYSWLGR